MSHRFLKTPTTTELINNPSGKGGFNPNLNPQTSLSQELGVRGAAHGFQYETTLFYIYTWNEILPFERPEFPGRAFFRNSGQSSRLGVETRLATPEWKGLRGEVSYTLSDFEFEKYAANDVSLNGNAFPGVPRHRWEGLLRYTHPLGFFSQLHVQRVGAFYVNDNNTEANNAYNLGQLLFGWGKRYRWLDGSVFSASIICSTSATTPTRASMPPLAATLNPVRHSMFMAVCGFASYHCEPLQPALSAKLHDQILRRSSNSVTF